MCGVLMISGAVSSELSWLKLTETTETETSQQISNFSMGSPGGQAIDREPCLKE